MWGEQYQRHLCQPQTIYYDWAIISNLEDMNSHLLMVKMHKTIGAITCIPNNADQYLSFSVGQRKFLDIFQLMASSLEKLVNATHKADYQLTKNVFGSKTLNPIKKRCLPI